MMVSGGTVSSDLSSLNSYFQSFSSEVGNLSSSWKGISYDNLNTKANAFIEEYSSGIKGQMESFASACDLYVEYETCKTNLSIAQNNYNQAVANKDSSAITNYGNQITSYSTNLNSLKSQIESLLASASSVQFQAASTTGSALSASLDALGTPSYGTFEKKTYTATNGTTLEYYMYTPDYGKSVSGLPIHLYFHGSGETGSGVLNCGLPKLIKEQSINPSGIVLCLQAKSRSDFSNDNYLDAIMELTQNVASESGGDMSRVSASGHSMGAMASYRIAKRYPDTITAIVPISGYTSRVEQLKDVKVWAFHGANDSSVDYNSAVYTIKQLQSLGGNARLYTFSNAGHGGVQNYTFEEEYEDENGNKINPLEWAFRQTKNDPTSL